MANLDIEITVAEVAARRAAGEQLYLLDVREAAEFDHCRIEGARHIPLAQIPPQLEEMAKTPEVEIICYCHHGGRSLRAADWMRRSGLPNARSMAGGIDAWAREVDAAVPRY